MSSWHARVVIVEDEAIVAMDLQRRVEGLGHSVVGTAASRDAALCRVADTKPDLILLDIRLRGKEDGIAAAEDVRRRWNVPVIFLTAFSDRRTLARARGAGSSGYLVKPIDDGQLDIAIDVALARHDAEQRLELERRRSATVQKDGGRRQADTDRWRDRSMTGSLITR
jgi:AmiR/NasT family two-component response regulator